MHTHYVRLLRMFNEARELRSRLFPSPHSDLWVALGRVEDAIEIALDATPERQAELMGEWVELTPDPKTTRIIRER